jgi:hypothetical protein
MKASSYFKRAIAAILVAVTIFTAAVPSAEAGGHYHKTAEEVRVEAVLAYIGWAGFEVARRSSETAFERAISAKLRDMCLAAAIKRSFGTGDTQAAAAATVMGLAVEGRLNGGNLTAEGFKAAIGQQMRGQSFEAQALWNVGIFLEEMFNQWQQRN